MSVRQFVTVAIVSWLPRAYGAWAVFSGLLQLAYAVRRGRRSGTQWGMLSSGARSALAGVLVSSDAMGAVYFVIAGWWWAVGGFRHKRTGTS